jgi:hypothetical protein
MNRTQADIQLQEDRISMIEGLRMFSSLRVVSAKTPADVSVVACRRLTEPLFSDLLQIGIRCRNKPGTGV